MLFGGNAVMRTPPQQTGRSETWGGQDESSQRKAQAEYANQLRHSLDGNSRPFMSALSTMYGEQQVQELERKRRQQNEFAESLRKQIEEKKKANAQQHETYTGVARQARKILNNINSDTDQPSPIQQQQQQKQQQNAFTAPQLQPAHIDLPIVAPSKARTMPTNQLRAMRNSIPQTLPRTFAINTQSPFENSTVVTPPLGFSLRRSMPIKKAFDFSEQTKPSKLISGSTMPRKDFQHQAGRFTSLDRKAAPLDLRLESQSELIYPDGHISAISSPHSF